MHDENKEFFFTIMKYNILRYRMLLHQTVYGIHGLFGTIIMGDFNSFYFPLILVASAFTTSYISGNYVSFCLIITYIHVCLCFPIG